MPSENWGEGGDDLFTPRQKLRCCQDGELWGKLGKWVLIYEWKEVFFSFGENPLPKAPGASKKRKEKRP
jgi:hypothetical protein